MAQGNPTLCYGHVVWATLIDPNGHPKKRPGIILTPTHQIPAAAQIVLLCISTRDDGDRPATHVLLPFHPEGKCATGLTRRCWAILTWTNRIAPANVIRIMGHVPQPLMSIIQYKLDVLSLDRN